MPQDHAGRRRWVIGALALYGLGVAVILLAPVGYSGIVKAIAGWMADDLGLTGFGSGWIEFAANILMFVPLGFLFTLLLKNHWYGAVVGLLISAGAEAVQIVIPSRQASLRDILANSVGAALGAALAWLLVLRLDRRSRREQHRSPEPAGKPSAE